MTSIASTQPAKPPSRLRQFFIQNGLVLGAAVFFIIVLLIYLLYLPMAEPSNLAFYLRTLLMATAGFMPVILWLSFARGRLRTVYNEFRQNLRRLGFPENAAIYADKFVEVYSYLPASAPEPSPTPGIDEGPARRYSLTTLLPIVFATGLSFFGWIIVFYPPDAAPAVGLAPVASPLSYAFLGAYIFSLSSLIRQYFLDDVQPRYYAEIIIRYITVLVLAWLVPLLAPLFNIPPESIEELTLLIAFFAGIFPMDFLRIALRKIGSFIDFDRSFLDEAYPLSRLDGLNVFQEDRLKLEGIDSLQNMACANLVDLMLRTRYPVERIVDWIDQSLLYLHARELLPIFHISGVRGASDLLDIYQPESALPGRSALPRPEPAALTERRLALARLMRSNIAAPQSGERAAPAYAAGLDETGLLALLDGIAASLVDSPNIYHVQYWRQHEFEALPDDVERERIRADLRLVQGVPAEAVEIYDSLLERFPTSYNTLLYRGLAFFQMGSFARAIQDYKEAVERGGPRWSNLKTAYLELGRAHRDLEDDASAARCYKQALEVDPDFNEARLELAYLQLTRVREYTQAIEHFNFLLEKHFKKAEALANRGLARFELWRAGRMQPAAPAMGGAPAAPVSTVSVAEDLLALAHDDLTQALRIDPGLVAAYLNLAQLQIEQGREELAIETFTRALPQIESQRTALAAGRAINRAAGERTLVENAYRVRLQRGNLLFNRGRTAEAAEDYQAAARLIPYDVAAIYNLGKAQQRLGQVTEAALSFREAVRIKPGHGPAHQDLGDLLARTNRPTDAEPEYTRALQIAREQKDLSGQAVAHLSLGRLYRTLPGREAEARRELEQAQKMGDDLEDELVYTTAMYELGLLLAEREPEQAVVLLDTASTLFEVQGRARESVKAGVQLGQVYRKLRDRANAHEAYRRAGEQLDAIFDLTSGEDKALDAQIKDGLEATQGRRRPPAVPPAP